jgi:hypothetical protein
VKPQYHCQHQSCGFSTVSFHFISISSQSNFP